MRAGPLPDEVTKEPQRGHRHRKQNYAVHQREQVLNNLRANIAQALMRCEWTLQMMENHLSVALHTDRRVQ